MVRQTRKIVHIDQDKCDGCGLCVPNCAEGAIQVINGKARLVAERLCDGLGACLGHCPKDAISVEERPADEFDESAVAARQAGPAQPAGSSFAPVVAMGGQAPVRGPIAHPAMQPVAAGHVAAGGCPGSRVRFLQPATPPSETSTSTGSGARAPMSRLRQWPVQLTLLPSTGPIWKDADLLLAADCVPSAYPAFHDHMLAGKTLAIACPKLDDCDSYVQKLAVIFSSNSIRSVTVARMEVPCCGGLVRVVEAALAQAGRSDIPLRVIIVRIDGTLA